MDAYRGFAQVYDLFMSDTPYEEWTDYLAGLMQEDGVSDGLVLDLGCGTGAVTRLLAERGYDMIGLDISMEMLQVAMETEAQKGQNILYLCQDMREFELYGTVRAVVSICDSMNYLLAEEELAKVVALANNYLDPGGVFIFDLNTRYKYETLLGDTVIAENRDDGSFIWENYYDQESRINEYDLTLFIQDQGELFRKYEETHYQRAYDLEEVRRAVAAGGMEFVAAYDALTRNPPETTSERIYIVCREQGKDSNQ